MKRFGLILLAVALFTGIYAEKIEVPTPKVKVEVKTENKELTDAAKDSMLYSKLSADQMLQLKRMELEAQQPPKMPFSIVLIVLMPFLFAATIIVVNVRAKNTERKRKYDLYAKSLEMGQTIPENFFEEPKKEPKTHLKAGIIWMSVGVSLIISFLIIHQKDAMILGIVPAFVGAGYLLVHLLEKPKSDSSAE